MEARWVYHDLTFYCTNCWSQALNDYDGDYEALSEYCPFCGAHMELPKDAKFIKPIVLPVLEVLKNKLHINNI